MATLAISIGLNGYPSAQTSAPSATSGTENGVRSASLLLIHGKIAAVDESKKEVTLEGNGRRVTLTVENPYNLKAAKVGDPVVVRYYEVVSIRKKKAGESVPAVSLSEGIATAHSAHWGCCGAGHERPGHRR